jgi:predicted TIM-barrel fold metal-dependent hydrolase
MNLLDPDELTGLLPAHTHAYPGPIPTQIVGSDEFVPPAQTPDQRRVEARLHELAAYHAKKRGITRRRFLATTAGMTAAFVAMNEVYGPLYGLSRAEADSCEDDLDRLAALKTQFVMDCHTHFLREDTRLAGFVRARQAVGKAGWNPALAGKEQTLEDLKFANYKKEIFFDSDTKVALLSGAPSDILQDWFLTNEMKAEARARVNREAGTRRLLSHAIFTPGQPGWLEAIDRAIADLKPDSFKGYTIGDNTNKQSSRYPWRMDDDTVAYKAYEKFAKAGIVNVCVHKGLFPPSVERQFPHLLAHSDVRDVGKAAKDWPQLNFIIYHSAYRTAGGGGNPADALAHFERTGRIEWVTDLAEIPAKYGVTNVYADLGQIFAQTTVAQPRLCAAMLGQLIRGLGADHVVWGTDAIWTGSPQWQIEAFRRLEIPEDMRTAHGFAPLGDATGPVKSAILGENNARLYKYERRDALAIDRVAVAKAEYDAAGGERSNLRYGWIARG